MPVIPVSRFIKNTAVPKSGTAVNVCKFTVMAHPLFP